MITLKYVACFCVTLQLATGLTKDFIIRIEGFTEFGINGRRKLIRLEMELQKQNPLKKLQSELKMKANDSVTFLYSKFLYVFYGYLTRLT